MMNLIIGQEKLLKLEQQFKEEKLQELHQQEKQKKLQMVCPICEEKSENEEDVI